MQLSELKGVVRRRVLVNFRVDPAVIEGQIPFPFSPQLVDGWAIAGICLIRLEQLRPRLLPAAFGVSSENAAHRVAVTWTDTSGDTQKGVYILRRDTGSPLNSLLGGRLFPGEHSRARFRVRDDSDGIDLILDSQDGLADVRLQALESDGLPATSVFTSLDAASHFFACGSAGYSATRDGVRVDGLELHAPAWHLEPLHVRSVFSSYYACETRFPSGSVTFDSALIMRDIPHEWRAVAGPLP
jgi:hypothetical protein